jgi:peroxiredoxin
MCPLNARHFTAALVIMLTVSCSYEPRSQNDYTHSVPDNAFNVQPLLIGEEIPDISVTDSDGNQESLKTITTSKPSMIVFYRGGWCPFCSSHLADLVSYEKEIYDLGYQILAISPDQPEFLQKSLEDQQINYTLLSDSSMELSRAFGVAFRVDDETVQSLKENGMDIIKSSGHNHQQLPAPSVFITDTSGKILFQYVNPEYRERIDADILMAALRAFHP